MSPASGLAGFEAVGGPTDETSPEICASDGPGI
ncbi:MAG: Uncharacterised protein [Bacteroidetes bacterium MED-G17]|nr:MAG: Uncharacterised protein [Bacteroidetes bacterium MED-G17]